MNCSHAHKFQRVYQRGVVWIVGARFRIQDRHTCAINAATWTINASFHAGSPNGIASGDVWTMQSVSTYFLVACKHHGRAKGTSATANIQPSSHSTRKSPLLRGKKNSHVVETDVPDHAHHRKHSRRVRYRGIHAGATTARRQTWRQAPACAPRTLAS